LTQTYTILDFENSRIGFAPAADASKIPVKPSSNTTTIVLSTVFSILFVAIVVGGVFWWRKKKRARTYANGNTEVTTAYQEIRQT